MTLLVFDTETTSLPHLDRPRTASEQPRMIQIGAILIGPNWEQVSHFSTYIKPEGWVSVSDARAAHGISERRCEIYGVRSKAALALFMDMVRSATEIASYNLGFDEEIVDIELALIGAKPAEWKRGGLKRTCIMIEAAQRYSRGRWMKLPEAHHAATGEIYAPVHRALEDAQAAIRVLKAMRAEKAAA